MARRDVFFGITIDGLRFIDFGQQNIVRENYFTCKKVVAIDKLELDTFKKRLRWLIWGGPKMVGEGNLSE